MANPAWLITYPTDLHGERLTHSIAVLQQDEEELMLWYVDCAPGRIALDPSVRTDPTQPVGVITIPADTMMFSTRLRGLVNTIRSVTSTPPMFSTCRSMSMTSGSKSAKNTTCD